MKTQSMHLPMSKTTSELSLLLSSMVEALLLLVVVVPVVEVTTSSRVLEVALAIVLESFQWLYSVDLETAFPLQRSQGQCAWA